MAALVSRYQPDNIQPKILGCPIDDNTCAFLNQKYQLKIASK